MEPTEGRVKVKNQLFLSLSDYMQYSVEVENLVKRFGKTVAVNDVSFKVEKGDFFCVIGPSGCGKTTLLRLIAGLITPESGKIYINGEDYSSVPTHRRPISMVFQTWALFPHMTVRENVEFGLRMHRVSEQERKERTDWALDLVRMRELAERKPRELSGGQQQRVAIARAIVIRPEILLLDEPLGNLDFKLQLRLQDELKQIHRATGITFMYVTHDQRQAMALGTKIMVMNAGVVEQIGSPVSVYSSPESVFVAKFVGESNIVGAEVQAVEAGLARVETPLGALNVRSPDARVGEKAWLFWRPEHSLIGRQDVKADFTFEGELLSVIPTGSVTTYRVDAAGYEIKVIYPGLPLNGLEPGMKVHVGFNSSDVKLLTRVTKLGIADVDRVILGE